MAADTGQIVTVTGTIEPDDLGRTITHEHLFIHLVDPWFDEPETAVEKELAKEPVSLDNLWFVRKNLMNSRDNLIKASHEDSVDEVMGFVREGGDAIVDVTPKNVGGDPERVRSVSRETGVSVVHGTAHYLQAVHLDRVATAGVDEIADEFVSDVEEGIDDTDVRAGIVGEIGTSYHPESDSEILIHEEEDKVLRAGARASLRTGAALTVHPPGRTKASQRDRTYPSSRWSLDLLDVIEEEGLPPERVIFCHLDRTNWEDVEYQKELAERGANLEYDCWGRTETMLDYADAYPSDLWRLNQIVELIEAGYGSQLVFSHDAAYKVDHKKYGGHGLSHVLDTVVPLMLDRGVDRDRIDQILVENPKRILTFEEPQ